ncbi:MAG: hypothetical protein NTV06_00185, partial [candidate division Zixibacteria bacterium]|nr:hypothetical protein [candidate division Zixibacteria bacterium]
MPLRKNILLVSYYFPPLGMGGVGRPYSLFKYLPDYGYDVTVLTVKTILYPEYDHSLLAGVDKAKIARTGSFDPARLLYLVGLRNKKALESSLLRKGGWLYFPDSKRGWNLLATPRAKNIIKQKNIAAVITTTPPPSSHLIGMKLKKQ